MMGSGLRNKRTGVEVQDLVQSWECMV